MQGEAGGGWGWAGSWPGSFLSKDKGGLCALSHSLPVHSPELGLPPPASLPSQGCVEGSLMPCDLGDVLGSRVEWGQWWLPGPGPWWPIPALHPQGLRPALRGGFPNYLGSLEKGKGWPAPKALVGSEPHLLCVPSWPWPSPPSRGPEGQGTGAQCKPSRYPT